jgi:tetratricopeptide (TPR) repeat protein
LGLYFIALGPVNYLYSKKRKVLIPAAMAVLFIFSVLTCFRNQEYRNGFSLWQAAIRRNDASGIAHLNMAAQYLRRNDDQGAAVELKKAVALNERVIGVVYARIDLSSIYISQGKYLEALAELEEALKLKVEVPKGLYQNLGVVYMKMGKPDDALAAWVKEVELYPGSFEANFSLAKLYFSRGDDLKTEEFLQRAASSDSQDYSGCYLLGQILEKQGKMKGAARLYKKAVLLNPGAPDAHYLLGAVYAVLGDGRALNELKTAVKIDPGLAAAHNDLAVAYASLVPPDWNAAYEQLMVARDLGYKINEGLLRLIKDKIAGDHSQGTFNK